jgi:hypothetical protein
MFGQLEECPILRMPRKTASGGLWNDPWPSRGRNSESPFPDSNASFAPLTCGARNLELTLSTWSRNLRSVLNAVNRLFAMRCPLTALFNRSRDRSFESASGRFDRFATLFGQWPLGWPKRPSKRAIE